MPDTFLIRCRENGPLVVEPPVRIIDHLGNEFLVPADKPKVALCRCGQSSTRPFCDGSHKRVGFVAAELASSPQKEEEGPTNHTNGHE
jgi:CDGSH-type Zn-finger protein